MAVTTLAAVIDVMRTAVKGVTPTTHAGVAYKPWNEWGDFRGWAERAPAGAFRWFSIRRDGGITPPAVTNTDLEEVEAEVECVVAYPKDYRYGQQMAKDMDDCIEADLMQVEHKIGTNGFQTIETAGDACSLTLSSEIEDGTACAFGVLRLRVIWKRDMP